MSACDCPDPSDTPGTTAFAEAQEDMRRDDEIDAFVDEWGFLTEHPAVKLACLARDASGSYRVVIGTPRGIMIDGSAPALNVILMALKLDGQTRAQTLEHLDQKGATVAVVEHDDGGVMVYDISDRDETGVPPDPARWCWDRLATVYWEQP